MAKRHGYIMKYKPDHHKSEKSGYVYEHVLIAEEILKRPINNENVHHKDGNKSNNSKNNLMIFKTNSDHIAYHHGGVPFLQEDGTYITKEIRKECPICGNRKEIKSKLCRICYINKRRNLI